ARGHKGRLEDQVLGRIAGDGELGEQHEIGAERRRLGARAARLLGIAVDIADDRIELRERDRERRGGAVVGSTGVHDGGVAVRYAGPQRYGVSAYGYGPSFTLACTNTP